LGFLTRYYFLRTGWKYAEQKNAISASCYFSHFGFSDRFIGHVVLYIGDRYMIPPCADDSDSERRCAYVRFAVSGAPAYWRLDRAIEAQ
jgi:hypothetical protein